MKKGEFTGRILGIALVIVMIAGVLGGFFALTGEVETSPATIYVPDDYPAIQDVGCFISPLSQSGLMNAASAGDKIFDNGTWWIAKDVSEPHLGWMKIYLDGEYEGECSRLEFGHKVEGVNEWPTVAVIYASGYIRLKECREEDISFGTSFVLGPAYWESNNLHPHHNVTIEEMRINSTEPFEIQIKARLPHFSVNYDINMFEPSSEAMKIHVDQMYECTNQLILDESRLNNHEGFKIAQLSSMYINGTYHDSDGAKYIDEYGKSITKKFEDFETNHFIFDEPEKFGESWLECMHSDNYGWQGNTPNCIIYLDDLILARRCTPQGWIEITGDPNNDNVGLWIHHDEVQLEWKVGDKDSISYWLVAQDDPKSTFVAEWVRKANTPEPSGYGEAVVSIWNGIYIARCYSATSGPQFWYYDATTDEWNPLGTTELPTGAFRNGTALTGDESNYIYGLLGGRYSDSDRRLFYRYSISANGWEQLEDTPHAQGAGDAIAWSGYDNYIYALIGSKEHGTIFARYTYDSWEELQFNPSWTTTDDGASLVWAGGEYLYALRGEWEETVPHSEFARYHIPTQSWEDMAIIPESSGVGDGASLLWGGSCSNEYSDYIFALGGGAANEEPGYNFYYYSIPSNTWEGLEPIPCPVGHYVGNRLGCDNDRIYYWQGAPSTWDCGGDAFHMLVVNEAPDVPSNPSPATHATGVSINADLSWIGGDPDAGDTVTYDVYFGTSPPPPLKGTTGPYPATESLVTYDPGPLMPGTTYYWQIVARDNHGIAQEGPVWEFTVGIEEIQLSLQAGWNMVSMPITPTDSSISAVFPGVAGIFAWNATSRSYYVPTVIDPKEGYWVAVTENTTMTISGTPIETWTTDIKAGWNMIGSVNTSASIADPSDDPDGSVIPTAYWWDPVSKSYILTTDIEPGKGYWVASVNDCTLTL